MYRFQVWLFAISTPRRIAYALALMLLLLACFGLYLVPAFTAHMNGMMPIDLAFPVTPAVIRLHISSYDSTARMLYAQFLVIDCLYPPALAGFLSLWWASALRATQPRSKWRYLVLLPWATALLDLSENAGFALLIWSYPILWPDIEQLVTVIRTAKLVALSLSVLTVVYMLGYWPVVHYRRGSN
jgi:hypothetical protein